MVGRLGERNVWRRLTGLLARPAFRLATLPLCLVVLAVLVDFEGAIAELGAISVPALLLAVVLHLMIIVTLSLRWQLVIRSAGGLMTFPAAAHMTFLSTLANLVLPSSIAGDVGRVWLVRRHGLDLRIGTMAGIFDRAVGLVTLGVVALAGSVAAPGLMPRPVRALLWALIAACVAAAPIGALARLTGTVKLTAWDPGLLRPGPVLGSITLSLAGHALAVAIAVVIAQDIGASLSYHQALALFPSVLLASSIPASVGGWGVRELAAIAVFPLVGMTGSAAMAMTLGFGLTQVAAAGLGTAAFILTGWTREHP